MLHACAPRTARLGVSWTPVDSVVCLVCLCISFPMWCASCSPNRSPRGYFTQTSKRRPLHDGDAMYGQAKHIMILISIELMLCSVAIGIRAEQVVLQIGPP